MSEEIKSRVFKFNITVEEKIMKLARNNCGLAFKEIEEILALEGITGLRNRVVNKDTWIQAVLEEGKT